MRWGIFGGSFNPVHEGHLSLANFAYSELNLDALYFVPAFESPLKPAKDLLPAALRLKLLERALRPYPHLSLSDCEIERGGKSFTVDTLNFFNQKSAGRAQLYFLTGMDSVASLGKWRSPDKIFKLCRFVAASRPGHVWQDTKYPVIRMPFPALNVSSSAVRSRLKKGLPLQGLVPAAVERELKRYQESLMKKPKKGDATSKRKKRSS